VVTIAELDALLERYFPVQGAELPPSRSRQGRASVMTRSKPICPICKHTFVKDGHAVRQIYCSKACQQKAYRQRKKAA
jgi:formamidopyrimidine-DNA glycosylase